ncbi:hypothetical protein BDP27DRAFT_1417250 [Rhodocollybia butyracea]|uniref:Restriction of telomere capping protein 4 C-terminal domain-containing protein n=1 Tax=Rhodocollybia butyracea TaxID=206335 RepID=A0A9P5Q1P0_9AGAR|nr:hypothetical protein BDP27DRAFT_1417250 [Rhodocollybia butyracea]
MPAKIKEKKSSMKKHTAKACITESQDELVDNEINNDSDQDDNTKIPHCKTVGQHGNNLQNLMGLAENSTRWNQIQIAKVVDLFNDSEDLWPVNEIMKQYLQNHAKDFRESLEAEATSRKMDEAGIPERDRDEAGGDILMEDYMDTAPVQKITKGKGKGKAKETTQTMLKPKPKPQLQPSKPKPQLQPSKPKLQSQSSKSKPQLQPHPKPVAMSMKPKASSSKAISKTDSVQVILESPERKSKTRLAKKTKVYAASESEPEEPEEIATSNNKYRDDGSEDSKTEKPKFCKHSSPKKKKSHKLVKPAASIKVSKEAYEEHNNDAGGDSKTMQLVAETDKMIQDFDKSDAHETKEVDKLLAEPEQNPLLPYCNICYDPIPKSPVNHELKKMVKKCPTLVNLHGDFSHEVLIFDISMCTLIKSEVDKIAAINNYMFKSIPDCIGTLQEMLVQLTSDRELFLNSHGMLALLEVYGTTQDISRGFCKSLIAQSDFHAAAVPPGFFGSYGKLIVHKVLIRMFEAGSFDPDLIMPLSHSQIIQYILVPEVLVTFMEEDLDAQALVDAGGPLHILRTSALFGTVQYNIADEDGQDDSDLTKILRYIHVTYLTESDANKEDKEVNVIQTMNSNAKSPVLPLKQQRCITVKKDSVPEDPTRPVVSHTLSVADFQNKVTPEWPKAN